MLQNLFPLLKLVYCVLHFRDIIFQNIPITVVFAKQAQGTDECNKRPSNKFHQGLGWNMSAMVNS